MKPTSLDYLQNPENGEALRLENEKDKEWLVSGESGKRYPIIGGIPNFVGTQDVTSENKRYQTMYDRIARGYDWSEKIVVDLFWGGRDKLRNETVADVILKPGQDFLEVSIGTATNVAYLEKSANYFGLDISLGMLQQAQRNLKKWNREVELFQGNAEKLPFKDTMFDVVFHLGGINFFNDIPAAIHEMIRVAKPGAQILFGDETEMQAQKAQKMLLPYAKDFYTHEGKITNLAHLVPPTMLDLKTRTFWNGKFYMVSFRKP